jgi:uncharacterized membrane protein SirB2
MIDLFSFLVGVLVTLCGIRILMTVRPKPARPRRRTRAMPRIAPLPQRDAWKETNWN